MSYAQMASRLIMLPPLSAQFPIPTNSGQFPDVEKQITMTAHSEWNREITPFASINDITGDISV